MIVSVHQPQYLPWLGYFDKIDRADVFVLLDNVQFKKNEWQNRNRIKTPQGPQWLTVPVRYKFPQLICEVGINNRERWQHKQQQSLLANYRKTPHWSSLEPLFNDVFSRSWNTIADLNIYVVRKLTAILGITTPLYIASELPVWSEDPDERLIAITRHFGGDIYLAGSGGHDYMELAKYDRAGVEIIFQEYRHPVYSQLWGEFSPFMSIVDLIYNQGGDAMEIIRRGR